MKKKNTSKKKHKITVQLSERDFQRLEYLSKIEETTKSNAAKRILREQLSSIVNEKMEQQAKNQLGLFDTFQIDIFGEPSKVEKN